MPRMRTWPTWSSRRRPSSPTSGRSISCSTSSGSGTRGSPEPGDSPGSSEELDPPAEDPTQDLPARPQRSDERAADLALARTARAIAHRNFDHGQARDARLELHLDRPAVVDVAHGKV